MPRPYTNPIILDKVLQLKISDLKEFGYLKENQLTEGSISWGNKGSITIVADIQEKPFIELSYKYRQEARKYKVPLISMLSNLGKGQTWYFVCPFTGLKARKLYLVNGYFCHRTTFKGCLYQSQVDSKSWRKLKTLFQIEELAEQESKKYFKPFYNGKSTKKYLRLMKQYRKIEKNLPTNNIGAFLGL